MRVLLHFMVADAEKVAEEVLRLVVGYGETTVALTTGGPVRMEKWFCKYWSLRADQPTSRQDTVIALWLRHVSEGDVDRLTAEHVTGTYAYRVVKEESVKAGLERGPEMKRLELVFWPADLQLKKAYGNRLVYSLEPCKDNVRVSIVRVYQPIWRVCEYGEPNDCPRRRALTENIKARGVPIDDVVYGTYVPLDITELVYVLERIL
jgi:hypothetical protein